MARRMAKIRAKFCKLQCQDYEASPASVQSLSTLFAHTRNLSVWAGAVDGWCGIGILPMNIGWQPMPRREILAIRVAERLRRPEIQSRRPMTTPSHYKKIAVASTFSPRFVQVLSEAKRVRSRFGSELCLIYVGERDRETDRKFSAVFTELGLPLDSPIHYAQGDPATAILDTVEQKRIDMIIAGALEKEVVLHPFLGNVARRLVREASCSVMLFTTPNAEPKPLQRIVFVADYSDHGRAALEKAIALAAAENSERLYVIRIITTFDEIRAARETPAEHGETPASMADADATLEEFILAAGPTDVPIEARLIRGNTGLAGADFVQAVNADLLIVSVPPMVDSQESLPGNIAWITDVIPCNLWVVR
jgi:nucleotide-binding universal stress UspA family protein